MFDHVRFHYGKRKGVLEDLNLTIRPGEKVDISAFVRDGKRAIPASFPLTFSVRGSTGRLLKQGTAMLSAQGGATFQVELPRGAPTGTYTAQVSVPGDERGSIGSCTFHVEEFAAPRLEGQVADGHEAAELHRQMLDLQKCVAHVGAHVHQP